MSIKPILFNTEMVRAILEGRKTQTRRIIKGLDRLNIYRAEPSEDAYESLDEWDFFYGGPLEGGGMYDAIQSVKAPGAIGDILWVRKTWRPIEASSAGWCRIEYKAGGTEDFKKVIADLHYQEPWHPSIHMPKEAARIFLRVKDVWVERLQDIKNYECVDEGAVKKPNITKRGDLVLHNRYKEEFARLWDTTIKPADRERYGWNANPWVWVISFERIEKPEGWCL